MRGGARSLPRMRGPGPNASTGDLLRSMGIGSLTWYASILSAPLFIWMSRRFPFDKRRWPATLALHLAAIVLLSLATSLLQYRLSYGGAESAPGLWLFVRAALVTGTLPFFAVAATAHALEARMRARDRELEAARIRGQLAEVRLEALNAQLQPHFLFNTLQAISTLISRDPAGAEKMLANLADLLREVLRRSDQREIPLAEELRVLDAYLEISRRRFGERLAIAIDVPGELHTARVPFFILQPLVENALHHGVGSHSGPGSIAIIAERQGDRLRLRVRDDGPGALTGDLNRGIGLTNTEARLRELYAGDYDFVIESGAAERNPQAPPGFEVSIGIPLRLT